MTPQEIIRLKIQQMDAELKFLKFFYIQVVDTYIDHSDLEWIKTKYINEIETLPRGYK